MAAAVLPQFKKAECLISVIGDEDTVVGFLLAGLGNVDGRRQSNYFIVDSKTPQNKIEEAFRAMVASPDISIIMVTQTVAAEIKYLLDEYDRVVPTVLTIPSKDQAYDPTKDPIVVRLKRMTGQE
eukprot:m51a1_g3004 putative vacuolar atp synthase subunit (125) ;mRNA; r:801299-802107